MRQRSFDRFVCIQYHVILSGDYGVKAWLNRPMRVGRTVICSNDDTIMEDVLDLIFGKVDFGTCNLEKMNTMDVWNILQHMVSAGKHVRKICTPLNPSFFLYKRGIPIFLIFAPGEAVLTNTCNLRLEQKIRNICIFIY